MKDTHIKYSQPSVISSKHKDHNTQALALPLNALPWLARALSLIAILALGLFFVLPNVQAEDEVRIPRAQLDQILAPIALYPDTLLSHILIASTYPLEVVQASRWAQANKELSSEQRLEKVEEQDWDPSVQALSAFPNVLDKMTEDLDWMQTLGDTFLLDEEYVLSSVQSLRQKARASGSLNELDRVSVSNDSGEIVIESTEAEVVYVPSYDVRVVYGPWWWANFPPVHWAIHHRGLSFVWSPRIFVGPRIYFSTFNWASRHIVRIDRNTSLRNRYVNRRQVLSHKGASRWVHNPVHRRSAQYRYSSVNKRYTPNRVHKTTQSRPSTKNVRKVLKGKTKNTKQNTTIQKSNAVSKQRASNINEHLKEKNTSERQRQKLNDTTKKAKSNVNNSKTINNNRTINNNNERTYHQGAQKNSSNHNSNRSSNEKRSTENTRSREKDSDKN